MSEIEEFAIVVENVSKDFRLPHERVGSIKNAFTNMLSIGNRSFEVQHALRDISFSVKKGEFFGIVGRNGSGKSTLLKILAGIYQPTKGKVTVNGRLVPFIELGVGFNGELTGRENVYLNGALLGFSEQEVTDKYQAIVEFAEIPRFMDQKLKNYSSGMQVRLAFSVATILAESEILLIDEVLAVGDADFQKKCFSYFRELKKKKKTVIFVSHDMSMVQEYCERAILIEDSRLILSDTSYHVGAAYNRMFAEQNRGEGADGLKKHKKRWGDKTITYESAKTKKSYGADDPIITIKTKAAVVKDTKEAILGFKIKDATDTPVLGTNTKLNQTHLTDLKKGQVIEVEWDIPNLFNDGNYSVDIAIQSQDYTETYDWWEDVCSFDINKFQPSSFSINPIVKLRVKKSGRG